jgi:hypothetical protein
MSGKVKAPGTIRIEGVSYQLLNNEQGWAYQYESKASVPQQTSPEEQLLGSAPPGYKRTVGWLDWTGGSVGPDMYEPGSNWLASSQGAMTELQRKIVRPFQKRSVTIATNKGRVIDFIEMPFNDGTAGLYAVQEGGVIRRLYMTTNAETIATQISTTGVANGNATGVTLSTRIMTEASHPWTWAISTSLKRTGVLVGSRNAALVRCYEGMSGGAYNGTLVWEEAAVVGSHQPVQLTHWTNGIYANQNFGGEYLWASTAPNFQEQAGTILKQAIYPLQQEQDPFTWANWLAEISPLALNPNLNYINGLATLRDNIIIASSDGTIYRVNTGENGGVPAPIIDKRAAVPDPDAGRTMGIWNGRLFVPTQRGLYMYVEFDGQVGGTLVAVGPESIKNYTGPIRGSCVLYTGDTEWLYAAFYNGTDSYLLKGKVYQENNDVKVRWHSAGPYIPGEKVTALHVSGPTVSTNPVLCAGTATQIYFVTLPRAGKTILTDSNLRYDYSGLNGILPDHDGLLSNVKKTFMRVSITNHNISSKNPVELYARIDESDWVRVGSIKDSPIAEVPLPRNFTGYKVGLMFRFIGEDNTVAPYVQSASVDFVAHLPPAKYITCQVFVAQNQTTITGHNQYSGLSRLSLIETLKDSSRLLTVIGPDGVERQIQFDKTDGLMWTWTDQATPGQQSGFKAQFKLNVYDDFVLQRGAIYESDPYTEGTYVSYYDMTG